MLWDVHWWNVLNWAKQGELYSASPCPTSCQAYAIGPFGELAPQMYWLKAMQMYWLTVLCVRSPGKLDCISLLQFSQSQKSRLANLGSYLEALKKNLLSSSFRLLSQFLVIVELWLPFLADCQWWPPLSLFLGTWSPSSSGQQLCVESPLYFKSLTYSSANSQRKL